jgi:hypothetical protein
LSINTLAQEDIAPNLQELWLSWSGRDSVLFGWSNPEHGLGMLKKVCFPSNIQDFSMVH